MFDSLSLDMESINLSLP